MKTIYSFALIVFLFYFTNVLTAQKQVVLTGLDEPTSIHIYDNQLFYGEFQGSLFRSELGSGAQPERVVPAGGVYRTSRSGDFLYITEGLDGKVSRVNLTDPNFAKKELFTDLNFPSGIAVVDNKIYVAEFGEGHVALYDLDESPVEKKILVNELESPTGITVKGDELFITEFEGNRITKINLADPMAVKETVMGGLNSPTEVVIVGKDLYVSEFEGNKLTKLTYTEIIPNVSGYLASDYEIINNPTGLFFEGTDLYVSSFADGVIYRVQIDLASVKDSDIVSNSSKIFPSPSSNYIEILDLKKSASYNIHNVSGEKIANGKIAAGEKVDISTYSSGIYFLVFEDNSSLRFIKE